MSRTKSQTGRNKAGVKQVAGNAGDLEQQLLAGGGQPEGGADKPEEAPTNAEVARKTAELGRGKPRIEQDLGGDPTRVKTNAHVDEGEPLERDFFRFEGEAETFWRSSRDLPPPVVLRVLPSISPEVIPVTGKTEDGKRIRTITTKEQVEALRGAAKAHPKAYVPAWKAGRTVQRVNERFRTDGPFMRFNKDLDFSTAVAKLDEAARLLMKLHGGTANGHAADTLAREAEAMAHAMVTEKLTRKATVRVETSRHKEELTGRLVEVLKGAETEPDATRNALLDIIREAEAFGGYDPAERQKRHASPYPSTNRGFARGEEGSQRPGRGFRN